MTMFGRPDNPVNNAVFETPYPQAPGIVIAYPGLRDWIALYDPYHYRDRSSALETYQDMRKHHETSVTRQLDTMSHRATGRAVLSQAAAPEPTIIILPYDFKAIRTWKPDVLATTHATDADAELLEGLVTPHHEGTGDGSDAIIHYSTSRTGSQQSADEVLLHELLHATRKLAGKVARLPLGGGYKNMEEYLANLVENIYRSEKGLPANDYAGAPIGKGFLDEPLTPSPRLMLSLMRKHQPDLFGKLAKIETSFNPIRQVQKENDALLARIEQS